MNDLFRLKATSALDVIVAIVIVMIGILVIIFGLNWINVMSDASSTTEAIIGLDPFSWLSVTPWIAVFSGVLLIVYGMKRTVDNVLKILTVK